MKIEMIDDRARLIPENEAELNAIHEIRLVGIIDSTLTGKLPKEAVLELVLACAPAMFGRYGEEPSTAFQPKKDANVSTESLLRPVKVRSLDYDRIAAEINRFVKAFGSVKFSDWRKSRRAD
jgi:hypothetical protein